MDFRLNYLRPERSAYLTNWQVSLFLGLFFVLFSTWIIPGSISVRYFCLSVGCFMTIRLLVKEAQFFRAAIKNIALILVVLFYSWVVFHYFYITEDKTNAFLELTKIHKRAFLGVVFALGFGYVLIQYSVKTTQVIFLWILSSISITYFVSTFVFQTSAWWNYKNPGDLYIPKYIFIFFCTFSFAWTAYVLRDLLRKKELGFLPLLLPLAVIGLTFYNFYDLQAKNGFLYLALISLGFLCLVLFQVLAYSKQFLASILITVAIGSFFIVKHVQQQPTWTNILEDAQIALQTDQFLNWKYKEGQTELPKNEYHREVSTSTYMRVAWFKEGLKLVPEYSLGYGLVQDSFRYLALKKWPDSDLTHTHSGWLDLTLGFGIPGALLLILAVVMAFKQCMKSDNYYARGGIVVLPVLSFVFLTSETCEKLSFEFFVFIVVFFATVSMPIRNQTTFAKRDIA